MNKRPKCGIIMPISSIDECDEDHWSDMLLFLKEIINESGFEAELVSEADDVGVIQTRIVGNIYNNPIVICDVSCKNSNVMFELGLRIAFDKPVIIIKDDITSFSFDTSPIEHLVYPRSLKYGKILTEFREKLKKKLISTYSRSLENPNFSVYLKSFISNFSKIEIDDDYKSKETKMKQVLINEAKAETVWVVSPMLHYDVNDPVFKEIIKENLGKGVKYNYIVPNNDDIKFNIKEFQSIYKLTDNEIEKTFLLLQDSLFNNFIHEIVIYNGIKEDYFSYLYSRNNAQEKDDILIFTHDMTLENIANFKKLWKQHSKYELQNN